MFRTIKGGQAIPFGRGLYYMTGRTHEQGGIDVDKNLEVEDGEVMQLGGKSLRVFSAMPILNGKSPAQLVMAGIAPNKVFNAQERFKDINKLNDDGSKKARLGIDWDKYNTDANYRSQILQKMSKQQNNYHTKSTTNSPIFTDNDKRIADSEQGKMNRITKQIADKERIDNGLKEGVKTIIENLPIIGDAIEIGNISKNLIDGNYIDAGLAAALLVAPKAVGDMTMKGISMIRNADIIGNTRRAFKHNDLLNQKGLYNNRQRKLEDEFFDNYLEHKFPGINKAAKEVNLQDYYNEIIGQFDYYFEGLKNMYSKPNYKKLAEKTKNKINYRYNEGYNFLKKHAATKGIDLDKYINDINDDNLKRILKENPDYAYYSATTDLNPADKSTIESFIKRQSTSKRGVTAENEEKAYYALTRTYGDSTVARTEGRGGGGDRLNTNGGTYTSNSNDISNRFSSGGNSYEGTIYHDFNIDSNLPIEEQIKQFKKRNVNRDITDANAKELASKDVRSIESLYQMMNGKTLPTYERAYITDKRYDDNMLKLLELKHNGQLADLHGRWGKGAKVSDELFIPSIVPNNFNSLLQYSRYNKHNAPLVLNKTIAKPKFDELDKYITKYTNINNYLHNKTWNISTDITKLYGTDDFIYTIRNPFNYNRNTGINLHNYNNLNLFKDFIFDDNLPFKYGGQIKRKLAMGGQVKAHISTGKLKQSKTTALIGTEQRRGVYRRVNETNALGMNNEHLEAINLPNIEVVAPYTNRNFVTLPYSTKFYGDEWNFPNNSQAIMKDGVYVRNSNAAKSSLDYDTPEVNKSINDWELNMRYPFGFYRTPFRRYDNTVVPIGTPGDVDDRYNLFTNVGNHLGVRFPIIDLSTNNNVNNIKDTTPSLVTGNVRPRFFDETTPVVSDNTPLSVEIEPSTQPTRTITRSTSFGIKPTKPNRRKISPVTTTESSAERANDFRIPGIADVGKATLVTKADVSPVSKPKTDDIKEDVIKRVINNNDVVKPKTSGLNFTLKDGIGAAADLIGTGLSYFSNRAAINNMREPSTPTPRFATKLKTKININNQLDKMREAVDQYEDFVNNNTMSSSVARNNIGRMRLNAILNANQLYGNKENTETQLINQDRMNRQNIANQTITDYNQYQDKLTEHRNKITDLKGENRIGLISGVNSVIQNALKNRKLDEQFFANIEAIDRANPYSAKYDRLYGPLMARRYFNH